MKKNKEHAPSSVRTYDKDGFRRRAACVCVKDDREIEVLLVSRPRQVNQWIFPGGGIEPKEDPRHAASREVIEEAGVVGSIIRCLGVFETEQTRTCVYVLRVSNELSEWDDSIKCGRKRRWFRLEEAATALGHGHAQLAYLYCLQNHRPVSSASESLSSFLSTHDGCCCPLVNQNMLLATCQNGSFPAVSPFNGSFSDKASSIVVKNCEPKNAEQWSSACHSAAASVAKFKKTTAPDRHCAKNLRAENPFVDNCQAGAKNERRTSLSIIESHSNAAAQIHATLFDHNFANSSDRRSVDVDISLPAKTFVRLESLNLSMGADRFVTSESSSTEQDSLPNRTNSLHSETLKQRAAFEDR